MHNTIAALLCGSVLIFSSTSARAATTITFLLKQAGQAVDVTQTAYIDNGRALIKSAGGDPNIDLLFQQAGETMTIVDHREKTILDIDADKVGQLANQASGIMAVVRQQMAQQMENLSEADRKRMQDVIESMGGGQLLPSSSPEPQPKTYKDAGNTAINGYTCAQTEVYEGSAKISEVCTAQPDDIGFPAEDYAVISAMQAMSRKLQEQTAKISEQMGQNVPQFGLADIPGVPVQMIDKAGNAMTITQIQPGIGQANLDKPDGYTSKQMPSLPQLTQ